MTVIDIHTHSISERWLQLVRDKGKPDLEICTMPNGTERLIEFGIPSFGFPPAILDYDKRITDMDTHGIDISIVSLTSPNAIWGTKDVSSECARLINLDMAVAQQTYPDRIRFFATLPWENPVRAVQELKQAAELGAVGVMCLANIRGKYLNDPFFDQIWREIEKRKLPVLVHPTVPLGINDMGLQQHQLLAPIGFMFDTTLAISRMIFDGWFERFPNIKIIASHAGGYLPFVSGRMDLFFNHFGKTDNISNQPSSYLQRIYYDSIVYQQDGLQSLLNLAGADHVMFGTDYPLPTNIPLLRNLVNNLPQSQRTQVMSETAQKVFGI